MELSVHDCAELMDPVEQSRNMDEAGATLMKSATHSGTEAEPVKWDEEKQPVQSCWIQPVLSATTSAELLDL
eukprot:1995923-Rhodomonas_salina.1